jgi:hypothetical protein
MRFYAGIGSRRAPPRIEASIREVAEALNELGYCLRSGAAPGCDTWFEKYATEAQIFIPYAGFNGHPSLWSNPTLGAGVIASRIHPVWDRLSDAVKKLHARNVHQVLGPDLRTPSDFVVCWTPNGEEVGGTAMAMRVARTAQIPVFNLADDDKRDLFRTERVLDQVLGYATQLCSAEH